MIRHFVQRSMRLIVAALIAIFCAGAVTVVVHAASSSEYQPNPDMCRAIDPYWGWLLWIQYECYKPPPPDYARTVSPSPHLEESRTIPPLKRPA